jgi:hypothetical protein
MSNTIAINKTHANSDYSEYVYKLPNVMTFTEFDEIAFVSANVNYSWFNISAKLKNNIFSYKWFSTTANQLLDYSITITDGYYSLVSLNEFLITSFVFRGHALKYVETGKSEITKIYIEILPNANYYASQFKVYSLPAANASGVLSTGYSYITSQDTVNFPAWWAPLSTATNKAPKVNILSTNNFRIFTGFNSGLYPSGNYAKSVDNPYSVVSQNAPMVENVSEVFIYCNLIQNIYSQDDSFFYSFSPAGYSIGESIIVNPNFLRYDHINAGQYQYIKLKITDQDGNTITMKEPFSSIQLSIMNKKNYR